jgi:formylglycine-generating enzyme required for sulfatase activity
MELMGIPPGEFMLGSTKEEQAWAVQQAGGGEDRVRGYQKEGEEPRKAVIKQGFWMGRTEVTVRQWKQFVAETSYVTDAEKKGESAVPGSVKKGVSWRNPDFGFELRDDHPVSCMSWNDAMAFCAWLTERERKAGGLAQGYTVRLPTEVEWEYACRAGTQTRHWWGNTDDEGRLNSAGKGDGYESVAPTGSFGERGRNGFGLADMLGNVAEWCLDNYDPTQAHEERWLGNTRARPLRGAAFHALSNDYRCACRPGADASASYNYSGFRVCVGVER